MRTGRPPRWRLEGAPPGIFIEAIEADERGRFAFPPLARDGLDWLGAGGDVLAVLEERGRVRLVDFRHAEPVSRQLGQLAGASELRERATAMSLVGLQDRYRRLTLDAEGRMRLPLALAVHLDPRATEPRSVLFVARLGDTVELWSQAVRDLNLERVALEFGHLP